MCCAAPVFTLLGVAGAAATIATFVFAGAMFGLVVAAGALLAVWSQRRQNRAAGCLADVQPGPVDIEASRQPRRLAVRITAD